MNARLNGTNAAQAPRKERPTARPQATFVMRISNASSKVAKRTFFTTRGVPLHENSQAENPW